MTKFIEAGGRFMDVAYVRNDKMIYTGEQMALALLLHSRASRNTVNEKQVAKMLDDINQK